MTKQPESTADRTSEGETPVSQVTLLLGTTPSKNSQIQHHNTPDDISDILGTRVYQGYVETPLQTLDGIIVNQPKQFLPLAEEAKHIAEEIRIEKISEQWAGIPREQLLNQSFTDQLNSIQILEQLAPLQLAKENLPGDIVDILKRLGKVDNIPFNQLYYIAENCADRYYSKVIETFISILKRQFADHQLLLVNTAGSLKFLEEYVDRQAPDFNLDIDDVSPTTIDQELNNQLTQGTTSLTPKSAELETECITPAPSNHHMALQEMDWPDAILVEIPSQIDQTDDQRIDTQWTRHNSEPVEILQLEENSEKEKYPDLDSYLTHHNTFEASQCIHQDYRSRLLMLDNEKYYEEVDRAYYTYGTPAAQDYRPVNQAPGPHRTTQELMQILGKVEDKHTEKNFMGTGHLVPERGHYKTVFRGK